MINEREKFDDEFIKTILDSYLNVIELTEKGKAGNRSTTKVDNLHQKIASDLNLLIAMNSKLNNFFQAHAKLNNKSEAIVPGAFYKKKVDVAIFDIRRKTKQIVSVIELKFPLSSFSKNKNNTIEHAIGECVNFRLVDKNYYEVNIHFNKIPSFSNTENGSIIKGFDEIDLNTFDALKKRSDRMKQKYSYGTNEHLYAPNASLLLVLKTNNPIIGISKRWYYQIEKENIIAQKKNPIDVYDRSLFNPLDWDETVYINEYDDFLKKIISDLERRVL